MAIRIVTTQSQQYSCPVGWAAVTIPTTNNLVSIGVQTEGNQTDFAIVQNIVANSGTWGYVQVANTSFSSTNWWFYTVQIIDDGVEAESLSASDIDYQTGEGSPAGDFRPTN